MEYEILDKKTRGHLAVGGTLSHAVMCRRYFKSLQKHIPRLRISDGYIMAFNTVGDYILICNLKNVTKFSREDIKHQINKAWISV